MRCFISEAFFGAEIFVSFSAVTISLPTSEEVDSTLLRFNFFEFTCIFHTSPNYKFQQECIYQHKNTDIAIYIFLSTTLLTIVNFAIIVYIKQQNATISNIMQHGEAQMLRAKPKGEKESKEIALLFNLRLACLMAIAKKQNLNNCINVQRKLTDIEKYFNLNNASQRFFVHYCAKAGQLDENLTLSIDNQGVASVYRTKDRNGKVVKLEVSNA